MFKKQLLILLFTFWLQNSLCSIELLFEIAKKGWKFLEVLNNAKSTKDTGTDIISLLTQADDHAEIIQRLDGIDRKLDDLQIFIRDKENYIALLIEHLPTELKIQSKKNTIDEFIVKTNELWSRLMEYVRKRSTDLFDDLADKVLDELDLELLNFRRVLTPLPGTSTSAEEGLFMLIIDGADQIRDILCNHGETSHHAVLRLFHIVMTTEIKAHTLIFIANSVKYPRSDAWKSLLESAFKKQFKRIFEMFSKSLKIRKVPYIRSCDPNVWQIDKNYYGLYGYLQQTIYYLSDCHSSKYPTCERLNEGKGTKIFADGRNCSINPLNRHAKCNGSPFGCKEFMKMFRDIIACAWEEGPYRIRYVKHLSETLGTDRQSIASKATDDGSFCPSKNVYHKPGNQRWGAREFACSCQCPESRVKLRRELIHSNINQNYVIVGLRIHQIKNYIYIQIAEGKLEANGYISDYSWVDSPRQLFTNWGQNALPARAGKFQNLFFLGDVQLAPGFTLTGIQFSWLPIEQRSGFAVLIYGMKFDYKTGNLDRRYRSHQPLQRGENNELKIPTRTPIYMEERARTSPKSESYSHVFFQRSDLRDDYGQSTLPFLDGVPVLTNPLSPIGGVGFFYKGYTENYAGFLSFRLYPVNFTYFMETFIESHDVDSILNMNN